jgi:hypothetical protein
VEATSVTQGMLKEFGGVGLDVGNHDGTDGEESERDPGGAKGSEMVIDFLAHCGEWML